MFTLRKSKEERATFFIIKPKDKNGTPFMAHGILKVTGDCYKTATVNVTMLDDKIRPYLELLTRKAKALHCNGVNQKK